MQWYDGGTNRMNGAAEAELVTENPGRRGVRQSREDKEHSSLSVRQRCT